MAVIQRTEIKDQDPGRALDWDEIVYEPDEGEAYRQEKEYKVVDPHWVEIEELNDPGEDWKPVQELIEYLTTLFEPNELVGYVTDSWHVKEDEVYLPKPGNYDRTAGQLIQALNECQGEIWKAFPGLTDEVGAWIRFNPVDGQGVKDANVTSYRFALVEYDEIPVPQQFTLLKKLELPIAAMVHSGKKSVHAIVRIEADTMIEYRKRVDFLYEVCGRNGMKIDRQNRNPSRLTRMPGILRNGKKQWLIGTNMGKTSWVEWEEWIVDLNDDLPDIEDLVVGTTEPEVAPELIKGILREGHKMLLSGPSKAHKSFCVIQLCVSIAEGRPWLGWETLQGRVLYVNLELDEKSCLHRFWATYRASGGSYTPGMIDIWNLRGSATSLDKLTPKLIRRAQKKEYKAIIIDPIYKVLTGDENSAGEMAHFCNQFDKICKELNAATIFCHHHSKGAQGQKASFHRASGSGVFSRDPDTIVDLIELVIDEDLRAQIVNDWECEAIRTFLDQNLKKGWQSLVADEDLNVADKLFDWGVGQLGRDSLPKIRSRAHLDAQMATGWRLEATLREFPPIPTRTMFFRYPTHLIDSRGLLADAKAEGEEPSWIRKRMTPAERQKRRLEDKEQRRMEQLEELEVAIKQDFEGPAPVKKVANMLGVTERTVRNRVSWHPKYMIRSGCVVEVEPEMDFPATETPF